MWGGDTNVLEVPLKEEVFKKPQFLFFCHESQAKVQK